MGTTTITVFPHNNTRPFNEQASWSWTLTATRAFNLLRVNGITHDENYLWFCTDGVPGAGGEPTKIACVDPEAKILRHQYDYNTTNSLVDIAWNGTGFYGIETASGLKFLVSIVFNSITGNWDRDKFIGFLDATSSGIDFDGYFLWVKSQTHIQQWVVTGTKTHQLIDRSVQPATSGITLDGAGGVYILSIPSGFFPKITVDVQDAKDGNNVGREKLQTGTPVTGDKGPCVIEWRNFPRRRGYRLYRFRSSN